jgi:hypothetical protein
MIISSLKESHTFNHRRTGQKNKVIYYWENVEDIGRAMQKGEREVKRRPSAW